MDLTPQAELQKLKEVAEEKASSSQGADMNTIKSMLQDFILPLVLDHPQRHGLRELAMPSLLTPQHIKFEPESEISQQQYNRHTQKHCMLSSPTQVSYIHQQRNGTSLESTYESPWKQEVSLAMDYPELTTWLAKLNTHPVCGHDKQNYLQYAAMFTEHGLLCPKLAPNDLLGISVE